ncbi:C40 family peptidase [Oxalobacter sp. OttesenSCG-928-P03]|nr:C40 family peptidase [Oxalobacter sp. OttesenSCG-928-P03]
MTRKKPTFIRSILLSVCLMASLAGISSPAWSAGDDDKTSSFYDYSQRAAELAMQAMSVVDAQYRYGGNSPETGVDCSGLVRYVYKKAWGAELPRTAAAISEVGESIETAELQPGDLVFYNTQRRRFSHVGIYLGDNKFVHAPSKGGKVRVEDMAGSYWQVRFNGARRITDPEKERIETERMIQAFRDDAKPKTLVRSR